MAEPPKNDRTPSSAGQSCRECRRRKGKCDGKMPVCSVCQRYNRHCLYDKHSRSSLTRKHLTEVEERLEKAEALLRTFFTDAELSQMLAHGVSSVANATPTASANVPRRAESLSTQPGTVSSPLGAFLARDSSAASAPGANGPFSPGYETDQKFEFGTFQTSEPSSTGAPAPFENVPTADDDFEWDEREPSWDLADPGGSSKAFESDMDADIPKITDGMATLTADDSNTGFLGSVSGAALLRLIWMGNSTDGGDDRVKMRTERRKSLEELFKKNPDDYTSSLSWLQTQPLITRAVVDNLVDAYFTHYHTTFPILHEATFREQYSRLNGRPGRSTWHILVNLVAALGSFVSTGCSDDTHITLFNAVKANLTIESLETGSLGLVQAFAMAANYLQKRNRPNSGYNYGGIALRLAISLGLHKDFHGWQTAPFKKEIRRRVWWSLCVLDVGATMTYGRPLNWPQVGVEAAFPLNIHEKVGTTRSASNSSFVSLQFVILGWWGNANMREQQDLTPSSTNVPQEANEATLYTYVRTQSLYHLRTMRIYNRLISNPVPSAAELISLDDELIAGWLGSLPAYYCDGDLPLPQELLLGHAIGRWRYRLLRIIMYRPFLIRWAQDGSGAVKSLSSSTPESIATMRCFTAAEECISCIYQFWSVGIHTRLAAWYVLYFLLQAALIPIHCLRRNPSHVDAGSWRTQVQTALAIINAMTNLNPSAPKCRDIIYRLCGSSLEPERDPDSDAGGPSSSSRIRSQPGQSGYTNPHRPGFGPDRHTNMASASDDSSWPPTMFPMAGFANPAYPYTAPPSAEDTTGTTATGGPDSAMTDPWMTEVDTAIINYDVYCDRLSHAAMAGMETELGPTHLAGTDQNHGDDGLASGSDAAGDQGPGPSNATMPFTMDGTEIIGNGVQDWDWGLML